MFGLFLTEDEAESFCKQYGKIEDNDEESYDLNDLASIFQTCVFYDEDWPDVNFVNIYGHSTRNQYGLFFEAERQSDAFHTAYSSVEECVLEFKKYLQEYLPDDFDYVKHIGYRSFIF